MIATITTAATTTAATASGMFGGGATGTLATVGMLATVMLMMSLVLKELIRAYTAERVTSSGTFKRCSQYLDVLVVPLVFVFGVIVVTQVLSLIWGV